VPLTCGPSSIAEFHAVIDIPAERQLPCSGKELKVMMTDICLHVCLYVTNIDAAVSLVTAALLAFGRGRRYQMQVIYLLLGTGTYCPESRY